MQRPTWSIKQPKSKEKLPCGHSPKRSVLSVVRAVASAANVSRAACRGCRCSAVGFLPAACCPCGSAWRTAWCWSRQSLPPPRTAVRTPPSSADSSAAEEWPRPAGAPSPPRHCAAAETESSSGRKEKVQSYSFYTILNKELFKPHLTDVSQSI